MGASATPSIHQHYSVRAGGAIHPPLREIIRGSGYETNAMECSAVERLVMNIRVWVHKYVRHMHSISENHQRISYRMEAIIKQTHKWTQGPFHLSSRGKD
jgi:hypothetical protein